MCPNTNCSNPTGCGCSWASRDLACKAHLAGAGYHLALSTTDAAGHTITATQELLMERRQSSSRAGPLHHPVQTASAQILHSQLAFSTYHEKCRPGTQTTVGCVTRTGHECRRSRPKAAQRSRRAGAGNKGKAACTWRALLEQHLWDLLPCLQDIQNVPSLYRYTANVKSGLPP